MLLLLRCIGEEAVAMHIDNFNKVVIARFLSWLTEFLVMDIDQSTMPLIGQQLWRLGVITTEEQTRNLYFVRYIDTGSAASLQQQLAHESDCASALVLVISEKMLGLLGRLPSGMVGISLERLLARNATNSKCLDLVRQACEERYSTDLHFSTDCRQVKWRGKSYLLTKKQSTALVALVRAGGRAHKDLLCAEAGTNQILFHIFRNRVKGQMVTHPLWGTLITSDGDGYYTLNT